MSQPTNASEPKDAQSLRTVETQKTIRLLIVVLAALALGFYALMSLSQHAPPGGGGKMEVDLTHGKVSLSLDKPIVQQAGVPTTQAKNSNIEYTNGKIDNPEIVKEVNSLGPSQPTRFSGKNFINRDAGFVLTVEHPEAWMISYNPAGNFNPAIALNSIYNTEGSNLNVGISQIAPSMTVQQFVNANLQVMRQTGALPQMPQVTYDQASETAFAIFTNPYTGGQSYQKVTIDRQRGRVFVVSANYNQALSSPAAIQDLIGMISSFTLLGA
jgi:hypothetical protein